MPKAGILALIESKFGIFKIKKIGKIRKKSQFSISMSYGYETTLSV